jgi:GAF domain-containing protein
MHEPTVGVVPVLSRDRLADVFVELADTLVDDFDLIDFLHNLTLHAATVTESPAVGILLSDLRGGLNHVAASSERAEVLELFQLQHSEGPCVDCYRSGLQVIEPDIGADPERWSTFSPQALKAGLGAVHAFPMRLRHEVIGALNVFGASGASLGPDEARVVQGLADVATIAILQERAITRAEGLAEQLQFALNSRVVIEQAKGAISRAVGVSVDEAFELLRAQARRTRTGLTQVARKMVEDPSALDTLTDS